MTRSGSRFDNYATSYSNIALDRDDHGVVTLRLHTNGGPLIWSGPAHQELGDCFAAIAADRDVRVLIMTGTASSWCETNDLSTFKLDTGLDYDRLFGEGRRLLSALLDIEVPIIAAVNGPARFHPEIPALSDIVLAADTALFQDAPHFALGAVPGDGVQVVWPHLLGANRGRYFLYTGQELAARQALDWGLVNEILPAKDLMPRALELARDIAAKPVLATRYTRLILTAPYKKMMQDALPTGLALMLMSMGLPEG